MAFATDPSRNDDAAPPHHLLRQPRRISVTLSHHVHEALLERSQEEGRSISNLCAFLLEDSLIVESRWKHPWDGNR